VKFQESNFKKVKNAFTIFLLEKVAQSTIKGNLVKQEEMDGHEENNEMADKNKKLKIKQFVLGLPNIPLPPTSFPSKSLFFLTFL
jgi:hypothetical protein